MAFDASNVTVNAWRRENGRVGVRNHVLILPVDDISNAACEAVANNVKGTMASILQDLGEIPEDYLYAAGDGAYLYATVHLILDVDFAIFSTDNHSRVIQANQALVLFLADGLTHFAGFLSVIKGDYN